MTTKGKHKDTAPLLLSRETQELRSLWEISQSLYQFLNIDDLIANIIMRIKEIMNVETMSVALHDKKKNDLVFCWSGDMEIASTKS